MFDYYLTNFIVQQTALILIVTINYKTVLS